MTRVWGHRGASADAPENTMAAFELAIAQGAEGIELDVQRTRDGVLVVCHDERLRRTSNGRGALAKRTYAELADLDFSYTFPRYAPQRIPLLAEVLALVAPTDLTLNIELKNSLIRYKGMEAQVVELVEDARLTDRVVFSSFNHRSVRKLAGLTTARVGVLFGDLLADPWDYAARLGATALHPGLDVLRMDSRLIGRAHDLGQRVHVWTVDDPADLRFVMDAGADAVMTNRPALALGVRGVD